MKALITVHYKQGILDPQGKAVHHALSSLGISGVDDVRVGKHVVLHFPGASKSEAESKTKEACEKIIANPVIEDYEFDLVEDSA
ncbi:MAG: phosphoribosylformylglycinamidine synthase subunit PurS [Candidatus Marinimicrobia bacterium]|jgi:phosphoribosylformylglycinamidine synthase|nr:phosphoribosylformylglycinamidine synthase subunit PurS [Candidatus Neomarinimicrobiota bacterium]